MLDLNIIKEPIFVLDSDGKIIEKNEAGNDFLVLFFKEDILKRPLQQLLNLCLRDNSSKGIQLWDNSNYLISFQKFSENRVVAQFSLLPKEITEGHYSKEKINFQEIIDNLPLNLYLKNPLGEIIYINPYFQKSKTGLNKNFLGLTVIDYMDKETAIKIQAEEKEIWKSGHPRMTEKTMDIDGQLKSFLIGKVPAEFPDLGKVLLCYSIDVTKQKQTSETLKKEKEHAEASSKAKEQFISVISHEIRTPMNTVVGMTNLLLQSQHYPEQRDYLNALKASSDNLLAIVNDILDLSKIESGKIFFEQTDFSLRYLLENLKKTFAFKAAEKNVLITLNISNDIPVYLRGDPFRLNQILLNLISNSVKFTEVGTIDIMADLIESSPKEVQILFTVKDSGIGIPEDKLSLIFESFTQANLGISRKYGGTGLGLTITKKLIELQGGNIGVESKVKEGSKFNFNLKFIRSQKTKITSPPESSINKFQGLDRLRLLVVEDNKMNQLVVLKFLENRIFK